MRQETKKHKCLSSVNLHSPNPIVVHKTWYIHVAPNEAFKTQK